MNIDIAELIRNGVNVTIAVSASDLQRFAQSIVEKTKQELEASIIESKREVYYTPEQVMSMLNVSRRTLFRWQQPDNNKFLTPVRVGGLSRYRKSDIDRILAES